MTSSPSRGRHFAPSPDADDEVFDAPEGADDAWLEAQARRAAKRQERQERQARAYEETGPWAGPADPEVPANSEIPADRPATPAGCPAVPAGPEAPDEAPAKRTAPKKPKKPKKQRSTGAKVARVVLIVVLVIALVLVIAAAALVLWFGHSTSQGEQKILSSSKVQVNSALSDGTSVDASAEADEPAYVPTLDDTITYQGTKYAPNDKMVSVAFIGYDNAETGGTTGQADTVIVLTMNLETGAVKAISIPRDTMVDVDEYVGDAYIGQQTMQLCLAYSYGDGSVTSSEHVASLASRILYDVPISYYFTLNLEGIGPINDAVGGVTLTPLETIPGTDVVEGVPITLWGDNALKYVRWRDSSNPEANTTSSLDRQERQIQYLRAFADQLLQNLTTDPAALVNLYNLAVQYSWTNLGVDEFTYLATQVLQNGLSSMEITSLPGEMVMGTNYAEYYLDKDGVRQIVIDTFYHPVDTGEGEAAGSSSAGVSASSDAMAAGGDAADAGVGDVGGAGAGAAGMIGDADAAATEGVPGAAVGEAIGEAAGALATDATAAPTEDFAPVA